MTYLDVFGELPPPTSCDKPLKIDLKVKAEFVPHKKYWRPYPALEEQADKIERHIQECIDTGLVLEYKHGDQPSTAAPVSWWLSLCLQPNGL